MATTITAMTPTYTTTRDSPPAPLAVRYVRKARQRFNLSEDPRTDLGAASSDELDMWWH